MDVSTGWEELAEKRKEEIQRLQSELDIYQASVDPTNLRTLQEDFIMCKSELTSVREQLGEAVEIIEKILKDDPEIAAYHGVGEFLSKIEVE